MTTRAFLEYIAASPGFVFGIFVSLYFFFNCFALNQWLQYKRVGK